MTEVINVQVFSFLSHNYPSHKLNLEHKGIKFHLEISADNESELNLINSNSIQVFLFSSILDHSFDFYQNKFDYLKDNNINSKILIFEVVRSEQSFLQNTIKILNINAEHITLYLDYNRTGDNFNIFENNQFKDKLLDFSTQNDKPLESAIINGIFSQFLNVGKVEKTVLENFCKHKGLDFSESLRVLQESDNVIEHYENYYFIHDKCLDYIKMIYKNRYQLFEKGLITYEKLETILDQDIDIVLKFLHEKNILIKNKNRYGYMYIYDFSVHNNFYREENLEIFKEYTSKTLKDINLKIALKNDLNYGLFVKTLAEKYSISGMGLNNIFLNNNVFIIYDRDGIIILFCEYRDLEILNLLQDKILNLRIYITDEANFGVNEIKKYKDKDFDFRSNRRFEIEDPEHLQLIARKVYPLIANL